MSDPTGSGSGGASFLSGLAGGFTGGYGFRQGIAERNRRARLQADLLLLRQQEAARQQAEEGRAETTFEQGQQERQRMLGIRAGVAEYLRRPPRFATLGGFVSGKPPTRGPVPSDLAIPQAVGRALGNIGGVSLSDEEQVIAGSNPEVAKAILEAAQERARQRALLAAIRARGEVPSHGRAGGATDPYAVDQRALVAEADRLWNGGASEYETWDEAYGQALDRFQKAGRLQTMKGGRAPITLGDLFAPGRVKFDDMTAPNLPTGRAPALAPGPTPITAPVLPGQRAPAAIPAPITAPEVGVPGGDRITKARAMLQSPAYRALPPDRQQAALRSAGYSEAEIQAVFGGTR